ncbi:MAG: hypothetical protein IKP24_02380 [Alphaproteobacteria bacterium]|nr:hypothetical protein [Alphaproteobacteria bacterium]
MGQLVSDVNEILNYQKTKKSANNQRQEILQKIANDEQNKTNLIKKALASQRAKYGASGVSASNTMTGAVLRRMRDETAQSFEDKKKDNLEKLKNIKTNKPNLLKKLLSRVDDIVG